MTSYAATKEVAGALDVPSALDSRHLEKCALPLQEHVSSLDCDCDSLSDGREKADTTPENLTKIDDVIETSVVDSLRSHFWSHPSALSPRSEHTKLTRSDVGDDSVFKRDMDDKPTTQLHENHAFCNRNYTEGVEDVSSSSPPSAATAVDESSIDSTSTVATKQSFAFTIDHFNDKDCDPAAAQAKYKSMLERFQQRHRRGASMSKLETSSARESLTTSSSASPLTKSMTKSLNSESCDNNADVDTALRSSSSAAGAKVKLRARDRSTSRVRDSSKRHSWSPRSSTSELTQPTAATNKASTNANQQQQQQCALQSRSRQAAASSMPPQSVRKTNVTKPNTNETTAARKFTPRSTAMQLALQKVDFLCAQPPLADLKHLSNNGSDADNVSEAGTYTLDGDNYTEEEKDLMNIDKTTLERAHKARRAAQRILSRPTDLELGPKLSAVNAGNCRQNVLEVSYFHDPEPAPSRLANSKEFMLSHQSASSYLEKMKSRVLRNISLTKKGAQVDHDMSKSIDSHSEENIASAGDVGTFTSVTTSGVLAKQCALDARPKMTRRSSLSTSQIDSSEYVSNESKLKQSVAVGYSGGGFTDHQKAEYRLNVFTNQKDCQTFSALSRSCVQSPVESPTAAYKADKPSFSDAAVLKTAQNKSDWIQEWARNARARSLASCEGSKNRKQLQTQELMTRSYTGSETGGEALPGDGVFNAQLPPAHFNKCLASRYRLAGAGELDYASDPAISSTCAVKSNDDGQITPKSPSKIPSPMHSLGRTRSTSRTRPSLQNALPMEDPEVDSYLQHTAAAINNLQESLSRKNSLQSPHSGSPRAAQSKHSLRAFYSPEEQSPRHSLASPTEKSGGVVSAYQEAMLRNAHQRNLSMGYNRDEPPQQAHLQLMTSSYNEQQMKLLTGGAPDYGQQRLRGRKNSFDGNLQLAMPNSPLARRNQSNWAAQTAREANKTRVAEQRDHQSGNNSGSPLRRSSSYSARIATSRQARPQFQNVYTPPAARHHYVAHNQNLPSNASQSIKKSASSNNFVGNVYGDYDENAAYYIKDEDVYANGDELGDEYFSDEDGAESLGYRLYSGEVGNSPEPLAAPEHDAANAPLSATRYNKALLMRIERSKLKTIGKVAPSSAGSTRTAFGVSGGVVACPNTPELPRRNVKSAPRANSARQSMPRDSSLNRLAGQIPNSLASAKKQLLQTAAAVPSVKPQSTGRIQPKYLDISKYKPAQGNNFLRKNDAKITLKSSATEPIRRSPSSGSMGLSRNDGTRASNRSSKSAMSSIMTTSGTSLPSRAASAVRRDASVSKQKEAEMAMWKRRSKYDPMKAAAEDRRRKEEAKKMAQTKNEINNEFINESLNPPSEYLRQSSGDPQWDLDLREGVFNEEEDVDDLIG